MISLFFEIVIIYSIIIKQRYLSIKEICPPSGKRIAIGTIYCGNKFIPRTAFKQNAISDQIDSIVIVTHEIFVFITPPQDISIFFYYMAIKKFILITLVDNSILFIILRLFLIAEVGNKLSPVSINKRHIRIYQTTVNGKGQNSLNSVSAILKAIFSPHVNHRLKFWARISLLLWFYPRNY